MTNRSTRVSWAHRDPKDQWQRIEAGCRQQRSSAGWELEERRSKKWSSFRLLYVRYFWFVNLFTDLIWILLPSVILWILLPKWLLHGMKRRPDIQPKVRVCSPLERQFIYDDPNPDRYDVVQNNNRITATATHLFYHWEGNAFEDLNKSLRKWKWTFYVWYHWTLTMIIF
jgi:hypothetical protein